jgi:protocatechuate 3,4-dioxygenase beta subunit
MRFSRFVPPTLVMVVLASSIAAFGQDQQGRGRGGGGQGPGGGRGPGASPLSTPRDGASAQPITAGTATVSGVVVVSGTGQPARRARVTLNAADGGGSRSATTDEKGRYLFAGLAAGRYTLSASKSGHVGTSYGATRPGRPGTPIQLTDGQQFAANLQLPRGSVITGTVLDEYGEPSPGTQVRAMRYVLQAGRRTLQQSGSGSTDDRGIYRIYGLQPGEYVVSAVPRGGPSVDTSRLQSELEAVRQRLSAAAADAATARDLAVRADMLQFEIPQQQEEQSTGYAPIYYPGTTVVAQAAAVPLGVGEERSGIDVQLQRVAMSRIEGTVINGTGQPVQNIQLTLSDSTTTTPGISAMSARADAEGRFRFANVAPGNYRLVARANVGTANAAAARTLEMRVFVDGKPQPARSPAPPPNRLWSAVDVAVDGRHLTNVVLSLQQGMTLSGRIDFDATTLQPPSDLARLRVNLAPADPAMTPGLVQAAAGTVDATGKFTIPGVVPGVYRLTASGAGSGWSLASAMIEGHDTLDFPVEIRPGAGISDAVITFTDQQAQLSGSITNPRGQPASEQTLILYPADERFWVPQSRRIRSTRPATDGRFTFAGIIPGEYKLAAIVDVEQGAWFDPAFLQQIDAASTRITIRDGEKKEQHLQVAGR